MVTTSEQLLVVAGEASGDLHGAEMVAELRRRVERLEVFGLGGDRLAGEGMELVAHASEISVVGITEAARVLKRARRIFDSLLKEVERRGCRTAVLIDFPDFNLRLAAKLKDRGVRVVYYISPQLWAWRRGRIKAISRFVDKMLVLFEFEEDFYRRHGVEAIHVGHPLIDQVPDLPQAWQSETQGAGGPEKYRIALLPGSRSSEVERLLPLLCDSALRLSSQRPIEFLLIRAPTVDDGLVRPILAKHPGLEVEIVRDDRFSAIASCHLALCASGTATLEVGLLGTPMVVIYRVSLWSSLLGRILVKLPYYSLANLVLQERVVPELLQWHAEPGRIAEAAGELLRDRARIDRMCARLAELRPRLGRPGASRRAAEIVERQIKRSAA